MKVQVKLTKEDDWQEIDVVGFYSPDKHHTVRIGAPDNKVSYSMMKMPDGRVYDKDNDRWVLYNPETTAITINEDFEKLPYNNGSVKSIVVEDVLHRADNLVEFIRECHRVLYPSGTMVVKVPLMPHQSAYDDPETKNFFSKNTFNYFMKGGRYDLFKNVFTTIRGDTLHVTLKK
jgi:SAM-dependent methyltransferase